MILTDSQLTGPASEPVTLADVKASARIDGAEFDGTIDRLIVSAREMAEHETGRCLLAQTWRVELDDWPDRVELSASPVSALSSVEYWDGSAWTPLAGAYRLVQGQNQRAAAVKLAGAALPTLPDDIGPRVRLDYSAGYAVAPSGACDWIIAQCVYWIANPQAANDRAQIAAPFLAGLLDPIRTWQ